jgi:hypothetical protein
MESCMFSNGSDGADFRRSPVLAQFQEMRFSSLTGPRVCSPAVTAVTLPVRGNRLSLALSKRLDYWTFVSPKVTGDSVEVTFPAIPAAVWLAAARFTAGDEVGRVAPRLDFRQGCGQPTSSTLSAGLASSAVFFKCLHRAVPFFNGLLDVFIALLESRIQIYHCSLGTHLFSRSVFHLPVEFRSNGAVSPRHSKLLPTRFGTWRVSHSTLTSK